MKILHAGLRWTLCAVLVLHGVGADAAPVDAEMRAALSQLTVIQGTESRPRLLDEQGRRRYVENFLEGLHSGFEKNQHWSAARRAGAHALVDELAPRITAVVNAELLKTDMDAKVLTITEAVYPKLFDASEIRGIAAYFASPAYKKLASLHAAARAEAARTGQDKEALVQKFSAEQLTVEEKRQLDAFEATPLGKKHRAHAPAIETAIARYMRIQFAAVHMEVAVAIQPIMDSLTARLPVDEPRK